MGSETSELSDTAYLIKKRNSVVLENKNMSVLYRKSISTKVCPIDSTKKNPKESFESNFLAPTNYVNEMVPIIPYLNKWILSTSMSI